MLLNRKEIIFAFFGVMILFFPGRAIYAEEERDPFSPLINKTGLILIPKEIDVGGLLLEGVIYSEESPVAIINQEVLKCGEEIGGYRVLEINEKEVVLKKDKDEFILKLEGE